MSKYDHKKIEKKWQEIWTETDLYEVKDEEKKPKFYALDMFPYPSGEGLHVGHPKGYIATDVISRLKMLQGYKVLHPMGWDAFGLPAENYAIENKIHPKIAVDKNIDIFKKQLESIGFTYDWHREIKTTDPKYFKWTQWIFLKMFEKGLAYESYEPIIWCPSCKTSLANEDLEGNRCERCDSEVIRKPMKQWMLKITAYADRLLEDLDKENLDWEEQIKEQQRNWIGRSYGTEIDFSIKGHKQKIKVFTTRVDTIFGCTYVVLAPEYELIRELKSSIKNWEKVEKYIKAAQKKSELERAELQKDKTGVKLEGLSAINPFNKEEIPIFVADYVLVHYGTGAVMAVPAHDERDFEFAKKYKIDIKTSIKPESNNNKIDNFIDDGILVDSGEFSGITSEKARKKMAVWLERQKYGGEKVNYKMHDWVFSRQRYWGEPIPVIHCEECGVVPVPEDELPLILPEVEKYEPTGTGESPLAVIKDWVNIECPKCGIPAKRETNTMPQWAGSSWYFLRYIDPDNDKKLVDPKKEKEWMPVDLYVGGAEHATRHLIYARFWHKFLYDIGAVSTREPFQKLIHVGLVDGEDGRKMGKRWNNVVNPDEVIEKYGADSLRTYEMFMGPFTQNIAWSTDGLKGTRRFLEKAYSMFEFWDNFVWSENSNTEIVVKLSKTIKKVTEDIEEFKFNTAISSLMELINSIFQTDEEIKEKNIKASGEWISKIDFEKFLVILSPFAPHLAEELWGKLGNTESIFKSNWPGYDPKLIVDELLTVAVQINGKIRDQLLVARGAKEQEVLKLARESEKTKKYLENNKIVKVIYVPDKLLSLVTKS
jgi:leucyl-tRNA synthetase